MSYSRRINALRVMISSSPISRDIKYNDIIHELNEVVAAEKLTNNNRKRLLQVLHSSRATETSLKILIAHYRLNTTTSSMGAYLHELKGHGKLCDRLRNHYQREIVKKRNEVFHNAKKYPSNDAYVSIMLNEIDSCLTTVI